MLAEQKKTKPDFVLNLVFVKALVRRITDTNLFAVLQHHLHGCYGKICECGSEGITLKITFTDDEQAERMLRSTKAADLKIEMSKT